MRDHLRRYRALRDALTHWSPGQPPGPVARPWTTLAALRSGSVGSQSPQLPRVATNIPDGTKPESRVNRLTRWRANDRIVAEGSFVPSVDIFSAHCARETLGGAWRAGSSAGAAWR